MGITIAGTILHYTWTTYLPTYAVAGGTLTTGQFLIVSTIGLAFVTVIQPVVGSLSDKFGRKPLLIGSAAIFCRGNSARPGAGLESRLCLGTGADVIGHVGAERLSG